MKYYANWDLTRKGILGFGFATLLYNAYKDRLLL